MQNKCKITLLLLQTSAKTSSPLALPFPGSLWSRPWLSYWPIKLTHICQLPMHHFLHAGGWWMDLPLLLNTTLARSSGILRAKQLSGTRCWKQRKANSCASVVYSELPLRWSITSFTLFCWTEKDKYNCEITVVAGGRSKTNLMYQVDEMDLYTCERDKILSFFVPCHCNEGNLILLHFHQVSCF